MISSEIISQLKEDDALLSALCEATTLAEAVAIANGKGYDLSEADLEQLLDSEEFENIPLNAEQLAMISGGGSYWGSKRRNGAEYL